MDAKIMEGIKERLTHIQELAQEIEAVPNLLPNLQQMKEIKQKCQQIRKNTQWIDERLKRLVWGSGGPSDSWPTGQKKSKDW